MMWQAGKPTAVFSWEQVAKLDPDILVVMCCGFTVATSVAHIASVEKKKEWAKLRAVIGGRVYVVDGDR